MKTSLKFLKSDFDSFSSFKKSVEKQLGSNVYVGTDSLSVYFDYPDSLKKMLRPYPDKEQFEFELESSKPE